jgi:hypothetical protein
MVPDPEPPEYDKVSAVPTTPEVEVRVIGAGVAYAKVMVVADDEVDAYVVSPAFVAVTVQVPAVLAVTVLPLPERVQFALPADVTA